MVLQANAACSFCRFVAMLVHALSTNQACGSGRQDRAEHLVQPITRRVRRGGNPIQERWRLAGVSTLVSPGPAPGLGGGD